MHASVAHSGRQAPSLTTTAAVSALLVHDFESAGPRISIPRPEIHLVVRFGLSARGGFDVHALGVRKTAHRKLIHRGQRAVMARLRLGAHLAVLGAPASAIAGQIVPLEELWGVAAAQPLYDRLAAAPDTLHAAAVLNSAIAERFARSDHASDHARLALESAALLGSANVNSVARKLGVSGRHLRRVFRETLGVSPKTYAKLTRFHRALAAARENLSASWTSIAADSGYYDQAHLIAEFRAVTGMTPQALRDELRAEAVIG